MPIRILQNAADGKVCSPCVLCDKILEEICEGSIERTRQPYAGGEIQFLFSYGSTKFDDNINSTVFAGLVCDDCAEKYVDKMTRLTENHHKKPPMPPPGYMEALEKMFPLIDGTDNPISDVLDENTMEDVERMLNSQQDEIDSEEPSSRNNEW